ncbi:universal stress protein [Halomonas sp. TBZ9]|uniref:Universal stress protein n=1 Tax=Vreelandella azerica TaxID=2732867 RepID=A0A7Y3TUV1_9GAMM|nr:universal stress protein [Halomonas azerica]NOG30671.1 universal stress protein [Halomonas azerica]
MSKPIAVVIVPVDRSPASRAGVIHGALLAHLLDARLELLHVVPLHPAELSDLPANRKPKGDRALEQFDSKSTAALAQARQVLTELPFASGLTVDDVVLHEDSYVPHPDRAIVEHARSRPSAMLVMGARRLGELGKLVRASVTNAVVHSTHEPITVLHENSQALEHIGRILLPTDGSRHSLNAARFAGQLARSAELAVDMLFCQPAGGEKTQALADQETERVFALTREALGHVPCGLAQRTISSNQYAKAIVEQAKASPEPPIIIMGRRGLGPWQATLMGSISQQVISKAACPVTLVV